MHGYTIVIVYGPVQKLCCEYISLADMAIYDTVLTGNNAVDVVIILQVDVVFNQHNTQL